MKNFALALLLAAATAAPATAQSILPPEDQPGLDCQSAAGAGNPACQGSLRESLPDIDSGTTQSVPDATSDIKPMLIVPNDPLNESNGAGTRPYGSQSLTPETGPVITSLSIPTPPTN